MIMAPSPSLEALDNPADQFFCALDWQYLSREETLALRSHRGLRRTTTSKLGIAAFCRKNEVTGVVYDTTNGMPQDYPLQNFIDPRRIPSTHPPRLYPVRGMRNLGGFLCFPASVIGFAS